MNIKLIFVVISLAAVVFGEEKLVKDGDREREREREEERIKPCERVCRDCKSIPSFNEINYQFFFNYSQSTNPRSL
jgi:hypothetical protein